MEFYIIEILKNNYFLHGSSVYIMVNNLFVTSKYETTNSPIHEFKALQNVFKMKKQGLKFLKVINKKNTSLKRDFKRLSCLYAAL